MLLVKIIKLDEWNLIISANVLSSLYLISTFFWPIGKLSSQTSYLFSTFFHYVFCFHIFHPTQLQLHGRHLVFCTHTFNPFELKPLNGAH
jgi:hypothetical protein